MPTSEGNAVNEELAKNDQLIKNPEYVKSVSDLRVSLAETINVIERMKVDAQGASLPCVRELSLVLTKLQEARMWAGQSLSFFDTNFEPSDVPGKPETVSKARSEG